MSRYVKRVDAIGVYGRFDLSADFQKGPNIVYGRNGTGKTTLIHILANALNGQYQRFAFLKFRKIRIRINDATINIERKIYDDDEMLQIKLGRNIVARYPVELLQRASSDERLFRRELGREFERHQLSLFERKLSRADYLSAIHSYEKYVEGANADPILPTAYFPAFRTMIDAWISSHEERERRLRPRDWTELATKSARSWFGKFVPPVNFPSLIEIERRLSDDIQEARLTIGRADRELLSQAFLDIFESLTSHEHKNLEEPTMILETIRSLFERLERSPLQEESSLVTNVYSELRESINDQSFAQKTGITAIRVLDVYRNLLEQVVNIQERSFAEIERYLESVNEFLEGKQLVVDPRIARSRKQAVGISFKNEEDPSRGLRALSSGERQIVTLIYAATHMSGNEVVLIDEPELSLHVDWQRRLLKKMTEQIGERQIIACTHSPVIGADYEDRQKELKLMVTEHPLILDNELAEDEELSI